MAAGIRGLIHSNMPSPDVDDLSDLSANERRIVEAIVYKMNEVKDELLLQINEKDRKISKLNEEVLILKSSIYRLEEKIDANDA